MRLQKGGGSVEVEDFEKNIKTKFEAIKEKAYKSKKLPNFNGTAETTFSFVDEWVYQAMKYLYLQYDLRQLNKEDAAKNVEKLWLRYLSEKTSEQRRANAAKEQQDKKAKAGELIKIFMKPGDRTPEQLFVLFFEEFLPMLLEPVTARKIKEGFGVQYRLDYRDITDEERKLIADGWSQKGKEELYG